MDWNRAEPELRRIPGKCRSGECASSESEQAQVRSICDLLEQAATYGRAEEPMGKEQCETCCSTRAKLLRRLVKPVYFGLISSTEQRRYVSEPFQAEPSAGSAMHAQVGEKLIRGQSRKADVRRDHDLLRG